MVLQWTREFRHLFDMSIPFPLHKYPDAGLLSYGDILFFIFWDTAILSFSGCANSIPTSSMQGRPSPDMLSCTVFHLSDSGRPCRCEVTSDCMSLMFSVAGHVFIGLLVTCFIFCWNWPLAPTPYFWEWAVCFPALALWDFLSTLDFHRCQMCPGEAFSPPLHLLLHSADCFLCAAEAL